MNRLERLVLFLCCILFVALGCRKTDKITTNPSDKLEFSEDTVIFDTVFSSVGSVTKWLKVYNRHKETIKISSIAITGNTTQFRMNVDGIPGRRITNLEIPGEDSVFVFVEVTINPNNDLLPFLITDQIQFVTNGNQQVVDLVAYGQNARFFIPDTRQKGLPPYSRIDTNDAASVTVTWDSTLPIVIYGFLVVDEGDRLVIEEGTKIYFHNDGGLWVYQGASIQVNGTKEHPVVFQSDRLDYPYNELTGQWDRIWINEGSVNNVFNYAIIKNSFIGIQAETLPFDRSLQISDNELQLNNVIIDHCAGYGLYSTNYRIRARNLLVSNCGQYNLGIVGGGVFNFDHCTFANYWNEGARSSPSVVLVNYYDDLDRQATVASPIYATFNNCIITGTNDTEFEFDKINEETPMEFTFDHSLVKTEADTTEAGTYITWLRPTRNEQFFADPAEGDFHLISGARVINKGVNKPSSLPNDLDGKSRFSDAAPDIGAYEYQP
jgi:hypothetical protein